MSETETIIEIGGVKLAVDLRHARRIEEMRIGSRVKVLKKNYSGHDVFPGVVVGFEPFKSMPTIVIAYIAKDYSKAEVKFLNYNAASKSEDVDVVVAADTDFHGERDVIIAQFDRMIEAKRAEIETLEEQKRYFTQNFGVYWGAIERPAPASV